VVGHLASPGVPLTEPSPYGTTGAEFQENCRSWPCRGSWCPGSAADAEAAWPLCAAASGCSSEQLRMRDHCPLVCPAGGPAPCAFMHWAK
jgi:hypothetical protein